MNELNQSMIIDRSDTEICYCKIHKFNVNPKISDLFYLVRDEIAHAGETENYLIDTDAECDCSAYDRINNLTDISKKKLMEFLHVLEKFDKMKAQNVKYL